MAALFTQYFNIAFLMGKPQDLPSGSQQLHVALVLSFVSYVLASLTHYSVGQSVGTAIIDLGLSALLIYIALIATGRLERFNQSYGALCGAGAVLNTAAIPIFLSRSNDPEAISTLGNTADFFLLVWSLSVFAHIIRHTFEIRMVLSVILAFCYFLLVISMLSTLWPTDMGETLSQMPNNQPLGYDWWRSV